MSGARERRWRHWRAWPEVVRDAALPALLAALTFFPAMSDSGLGLVRQPARGEDAAVVALALGQCLPLVVRRRAPALCLALVSVSFALFQVHGSQASFSGMGLLVALYSAGAYQRRARVLVAAFASAGYAALVGGLRVTGAPLSAAEAVTFFAGLVVCWVVGRWVWERRAEEVAHRDAERAAATAAERARIARELHDVVTHHVTAMVIQADAAAYLCDRPERVSAALGDIAGAGRAALVELRHQLGVLQLSADRTGTERAPALEPLQDVVARARLSGQPVRLVQHGGHQDLTGAVALAVHRVVQESLTNALKHAPARPTTVTVARCTTRAGAAVEVDVTTDGPGPGPGHAPGPAWTGSGRGLAGLAERVDVLGGHLEAGPRPGGGFGVKARIPVEAR